MKKILFLAIPAVLMISCTNSKKAEEVPNNDTVTATAVDTTVATDEAKDVDQTAQPESATQDSTDKDNVEAPAQAEDNLAIVEPFLKDLYNNYLLGMKDPDKMKSHFSKSVLKRLAAEYDMDCDEGSCYGWWALRGDSEDPDGKVTSVTSDGDNWYSVSFTENSLKWSIKIKAEVNGKSVTITDFKQAKPAK